MDALAHGARCICAIRLRIVAHDAARSAFIEEATGMTELTPRQIVDAVRQAPEETARRFSKDKPALAPGQGPRPTDAAVKQNTPSRR
jgi:hypothetical protein